MANNQCSIQCREAVASAQAALNEATQSFERSELPDYYRRFTHLEAEKKAYEEASGYVYMDEKVPQGKKVISEYRQLIHIFYQQAKTLLGEMEKSASELRAGQDDYSLACQAEYIKELVIAVQELAPLTLSSEEFLLKQKNLDDKYKALGAYRDQVRARSTIIRAQSRDKWASQTLGLARIAYAIYDIGALIVGWCKRDVVDIDQMVITVDKIVNRALIASKIAVELKLDDPKKTSTKENNPSSEMSRLIASNQKKDEKKVRKKAERKALQKKAKNAITDFFSGFGLFQKVLPEDTSEIETLSSEKTKSAKTTTTAPMTNTSASSSK